MTVPTRKERSRFPFECDAARLTHAVFACTHAVHARSAHARPNLGMDHTLTHTHPHGEASLSLSLSLLACFTNRASINDRWQRRPEPCHRTRPYPPCQANVCHRELQRSSLTHRSSVFTSASSMCPCTRHRMRPFLSSRNPYPVAALKTCASRGASERACT